MKKIFTTWVVVIIAMTLNAQRQGIVELFVDKNVPEYDSLLKIMDQAHYDFVAYHYSLNDTLKQQKVLRMMDWHNAYLNPIAFVNGSRINDTDLLNPNAYQYKLEHTGYTNTDPLYSEGKWTPMPNNAMDILEIMVKYDIPNGYHIMSMVTESFPGTRYKNIFRSLLIDSTYYGEAVYKIICIPKNWKPQNCKLLTLVETLSGQIICAKFNSFIQYFTGTEEIPLRISAYPNPVQATLTIESEQPLSFIRIINSSGMVIDNLTVNDCQYHYPTDGLPAGLYFVQTANKTFRVVKR